MSKKYGCTNSARILHDSARFALFTKKTRLVQKSTQLYNLVHVLIHYKTLTINIKQKHKKNTALLYEFQTMFYAGHSCNPKNI